MTRRSCPHCLFLCLIVLPGCQGNPAAPSETQQAADFSRRFQDDPHFRAQVHGKTFEIVGPVLWSGLGEDRIWSKPIPDFVISSPDPTSGWRGLFCFASDSSRESARSLHVGRTVLFRGRCIGYQDYTDTKSNQPGKPASKSTHLTFRDCVIVQP